MDKDAPHWGIFVVGAGLVAAGQWRTSKDKSYSALKYLLQTLGLLIHTLDYCTTEFACR